MQLVVELFSEGETGIGRTAEYIVVVHAQRSQATHKTKKARSEDLAIIVLFGAGNGIRTRDFDLGKVALYH
jgi:hypothetical protein